MLIHNHLQVIDYIHKFVVELLIHLQTYLLYLLKNLFEPTDTKLNTFLINFSKCFASSSILIYFDKGSNILHFFSINLYFFLLILLISCTPSSNKFSGLLYTTDFDTSILFCKVSFAVSITSIFPLFVVKPKNSKSTLSRFAISFILLISFTFTKNVTDS